MNQASLPLRYQLKYTPLRQQCKETLETQPWIQEYPEKQIIVFLYYLHTAPADTTAWGEGRGYV